MNDDNGEDDGVSDRSTTSVPNPKGIRNTSSPLTRQCRCCAKPFRCFPAGLREKWDDPSSCRVYLATRKSAPLVRTVPGTCLHHCCRLSPSKLRNRNWITHPCSDCLSAVQQAVGMRGRYVCKLAASVYVIHWVYWLPLVALPLPSVLLRGTFSSSAFASLNADIALRLAP